MAQPLIGGDSENRKVSQCGKLLVRADSYNMTRDLEHYHIVDEFTGDFLFFPFLVL